MIIKALVSILLAAALGLLFPSGSTLADDAVYKWRDDDGVIHYSARPPEGIDYEIVGVDTRDDGEATEAADDSEAAPEPAAAEPPEQPEMARAEPDPELVAERCRQARQNMENLTQRPNIVVRGDDGEQRPIGDDERERMIREAQDFIDEWC